MKAMLCSTTAGSLLIAVMLVACNPGDDSRDGHAGVLVSVEELHDIRNESASGREPHATNVAEFIRFVDSLNEASQGWPGLSGEVVVRSPSSNDPVQLGADGAKLVYGLAIAWHLTGKEEYAWRAREMILDLTDTYGYRDDSATEFHFGGQGTLNLARGGTPYLYAALLLEGWHGWTAEDRLAYQGWLREVMYTKVAWASRFTKNNWGVAGSFSSALMAWYLRDHPDWLLEEVSPYVLPQSEVRDYTSPPDHHWLLLDHDNRLRLTPQQAFESHNAYQIGRMLTAQEWRLDGLEDIWGIQKNGAIPDEILRGPDPVDGAYLPSEGLGTTYTMTAIEHLTAHAEFLRRRGDRSIFDHVAADGSGSLLQAYRFVIDNPLGSHCFKDDQRNALYLAYGYYRHPALLRSMQECGEGTIAGARLALYGRLTHPVMIKDAADGDGADGDAEPSGEPWQDPTSGLTWQNPPADTSMPWQSAKDYCTNLSLDDHDNWRLPTISELRSLIRGCPVTVAGGSCNIGDGGCLSWPCRESSCNGCSYDEGPADGCYRPASLTGPCRWYWSSSLVEEYDGRAWDVHFSYGRVSSLSAVDFARAVRCVR